jgi:8-oxo-dGTP pyrophosphatase MutT (NUDIX family)
VKERLKQALAQRQKVSIVGSGLVPAAVLVPIFHKEGEDQVLFTRRTDKVKDHKGEISFPGGAYEENDASLRDTALRESFEEIGLSEDDVELLGELDDIRTAGSGFVISPFVGVIPWPYQFRLDTREVAKIIEVPVLALLDDDSQPQESEKGRGRAMASHTYEYQGEVIWGASGRILHQFLTIYRGVAQGK